MSKLIAYLLQVLGVFGILFFLYYGSTTFQFREVGLVFSILAAITGFGIQLWRTWKQRW